MHTHTHASTHTHAHTKEKEEEEKKKKKFLLNIPAPPTDLHKKYPALLHYLISCGPALTAHGSLDH
jgi:hypothetical protein